MSLDAFIDYLILALGSVLAWFVKIGHEAHKDLVKEVEQCVKKDDFKDLVERIERHNDAQFGRLFERMDNQDGKLDKIKDVLADKADRRELLDQHGSKP